MERVCKNCEWQGCFTTRTNDNREVVSGRSCIIERIPTNIPHKPLYPDDHECRLFEERKGQG